LNVKIRIHGPGKFRKVAAARVLQPGITFIHNSYINYSFDLFT